MTYHDALLNNIIVEIVTGAIKISKIIVGTFINMNVTIAILVSDLNSILMMKNNLQYPIITFPLQSTIFLLSQTS